MKLIVGLGNPGDQYRSTLHNVGFMFIDYLLDFLRYKKLIHIYNSCIYHISINHCEALLLKSQTYMNLSGHSVKNIMQHYKISLENILVISDDIYLKEGNFKLKLKGGHGGHNGLRSIIECLNSSQFKRLKIGVGYDHSVSLNEYLLSSINLQKKKIICKNFIFIRKIVELFIQNIVWEKLCNLD